MDTRLMTAWLSAVVTVFHQEHTQQRQNMPEQTLQQNVVRTDEVDVSMICILVIVSPGPLGRGRTTSYVSGAHQCFTREPTLTLPARPNRCVWCVVLFGFALDKYFVYYFVYAPLLPILSPTGRK